MGKFLVSGTRFASLAMAIAAASAAFGGYGDLPDTFDASTGYVTMSSSDNTGTGNQSFFLAKHWSDGNPPYRGTNYYVQADRMLGTPHVNDDVTAQQAKDPTGYLTFQGGTLVVAGYIWHLNGTYEFTFPDLHMLPGSYIQYTAIKPSLHGTMTVYGTSENPARINYSMATTYALPLDFTLKGSPESYLATSWSQKPSTLRLHGDLSGFYGTLRVGSSALSAGNANIGLSLSSEHLGGTIELPIDHACLFVESAAGLTAGGLRVTHDNTRLFIDGSKLNATSPRLTITNSLEMTDSAYVMFNGVSYGSSLGVTPAIPSFNEPTAPGEVKVIRLAPEAVARGGWTDAALSSKFVPPNSPKFERSELLWRDDADGGKTLWLVTCVMHGAFGDGNTASSLTREQNSGGQYNWSSETCPATDPNAADLTWMSTYSIALPASTGVYLFPGKSLILSDLAAAFNGSDGFRCDDMVWRGSGLNTASVGTTTDPARKDENGNDYRFYKLQGRIRVPANNVNTLQSYGARCVIRVESEVSGSGDITLTTINSSSNFKNHCGYHEFTALNTNFMGKVRVTTTTAAASGSQNPSAGYVTPNWIEHVRLFVSDERNLGGARDAFAWDALYLDQYSDLFPLNDVTFTDGWNRGVAIGNIGRMHVTNGLTLAILRPLNVNGNLVKEGGGTLALGGPLTFGGASQSAAPTAGANLLTAMGGFVKPLATNAFDGLAITFTNNAALKLYGMSADAGLLKYGLVNVKETTAPIALAPNQTTLPVTVDFGTATEPPAVQWTVGLVTLETTKAETLKQKMALSNPAPFQNWRGTLDLVANDDGTSTIVVNYKTVGMTIIFR